MDMLKVLKALKKWRWTFIGVTALSLSLIALAPAGDAQGLEAMMTRYQSEAKILLTPPSGHVNTNSSGVNVDVANSWFSDPVVLQELVLSEELLSRVARGAEITQSWDEFRDVVQVEPLSQNHRSVNLFKLVVTASDPKEAQKLTRILTDEFSNYVQEISAKEFANTRKFIEELVVEAEERRLQAEDNLMAVREKYLGLPTDNEIATKQMDLETRRQNTSQEIPSLQAEVESLRSYLDGTTTNPPWSVLQKSDSSLRTLESAISENRIELEKAREVYTEENSNVITAKNRLERSTQLYEEELRNYVTSLYESKSQELQQKISTERTLASQLNSLLASQMSPEDRREVKKLERELNQWEENHLSLQQQLYQARVVEQGSRRQGAVNVLENPRLGMPIAMDLPVSASKGKKLLFAIPFCLILGAGAALLREYLTTSMRLRPRIEEILEVPIIAVIPSTSSELTVDWERFKRPLELRTPSGKIAPNGIKVRNGRSAEDGSDDALPTTQKTSSFFGDEDF